MKLPFLLTLLATFPPLIASPGQSVGANELAAAKPVEPVKRHPLRGVITAVDVERSALMVKHEEIPGVMRAMTMLFKVDIATLKSVQKGQTITAMMSRQGDDWWLHDVKTVAASGR